MTTITFYSYKGGVGRTLVLANVARYLSRFGQSVYAMDFDLEAPGLHYKLTLGEPAARGQIANGVVDYLHQFVTKARSPSSIRDFTRTIGRRADADGPIWLMPAGQVPSAEYWQMLSGIDWHHLFYADEAQGIPLFLELRTQIEKEFCPDFLLIDSRTGITEIGGVATTVLPDKLVCLFMNNQENLDGTRLVLRSIKRASRLPGQAPIDILPVLTRIPRVERGDTEEQLMNSIKAFLTEDPNDLASKLSIPEIHVLHSDRDLELAEGLRIGTSEASDESPLLRDYLRLFLHLIPREVIDPHIVPLVRDAANRVLDDPDGTQQALETLSAYYNHPEALLALLKLYRLRKAEGSAIVNTASRYWELTGRSEEPILWQVVRDFYKAPEAHSVSPEFAEAVWRAADPNNVDVGLRISELYVFDENHPSAAHLLQELLERSGPAEAIAIAYIRVLRLSKRWQTALDFIEGAKTALKESTRFLSSWASVLLGVRNIELIGAFLDDKAVGSERLSEEDPQTFAQLLLAANRVDDLSVFLGQALRKASRSGPDELTRIGIIFESVGRRGEFEAELRRSVPPAQAEEILRATTRRRVPIRSRAI